MKYFFTALAITLVFFALVCAKKNSVAQAAVETAGPAADTPAAAKNISHETDQVKHKVMAFDLEGLADDGSKKWDVKGQSAESVTEEQVKLNNITASTYGKDSHATITADTGLYDKARNSVHLEQNVKAVIENTGKGAGDYLGMPSATEDASKLKQLPADADRPKKTKTIITCDAEVEFNYEKNEGYFSKNVHVVNDEGTIDADKITIYLDPVTKAIKTIVAEGNVKIRRGDNMSYSDKATYLEADKKIVLTGQPKLVLYQEGGLKGELLGPAKK